METKCLWPKVSISIYDLTRIIKYRIISYHIILVNLDINLENRLSCVEMDIQESHYTLQ